MELTPGHIHQATSVGGAVAIVWPTPWPDLWHVSTSQKRATAEPVPSDQVEAILQAWGFSAAGEWARWPGPLHETNPAPLTWAGYDAVGA